MRRQTLLLIPGLGGALAALLVMAAFVHRSAQAARGPGREVACGLATLQVPAAFQPTLRRTHEAWTVQEFQARGVGLLQLASEPRDGSSLEAACARWFEVPQGQAGPLRYMARGTHRFFKTLPIFGPGGLAIQKVRKEVRLVACFDQGDRRHWVELRSTQGFTSTLEVFGDLLATLRSADGQPADPALRAALAPVAAEAGWRFFLPLELLALLPVTLGLLLGGAFWAIGRRSGRLPAEADPQAPLRAAFVEIGLVSPGRWKFMLVALTVTEAGLTLRTFGTPFLRIPRAALAGRVTLGRGWFDPPYLEIPLDGTAQFLKYAWAYRLSPGGLKLRIYTAEAARLQAALG